MICCLIPSESGNMLFCWKIPKSKNHSLGNHKFVIQSIYTHLPIPLMLVCVANFKMEPEERSAMLVKSQN